MTEYNNIGNDFHNIMNYNSGVFSGLDTMANLPTADWYVSLACSNNGSSRGILSFYTGSGSTENPEAYIKAIVNGNVGRWVKLATATPPREYDLPLAAGVKKYSEDWKNCYSKAQDGLVLVHLAAETISGEPPARFATIATLPVGYRPAKNVAGLPIQSGTGVNGIVNVRGDGVIEAAGCTYYKMFGVITFYAA